MIARVSVVSGMLLLVVVVVARAEEPTLDLSKLQRDVVATERAFAKRAAEVGVPRAFHAFIADDGVLFRPEPVPGKPYLEKQIADLPDDDEGIPAETLRWWPVQSDVARSGDLAWNTGPWVYEKDGVQLAQGWFVTVWKKQADGTWRFLVDHGPSTDDASDRGAEAEVPPLRADKRGAPALDAAARSAALESLEAADESFDDALADGVREAYPVWLAADAWLLRNGPQPVVGTDPIAAALEGEPDEINASPIFAQVSDAGDLGVTWGRANWRSEGGPRRGHYLRIWEMHEAGWKVVLDEVLAVPAAGGG